jgi:acyl dehydratase
MPGKFFEDFTVGDVDEFGQYTIGRDEIIAFAQQFDPQPFHTDEAAAKQHPFGGLIASGWQTAGICMRLAVDRFLGPDSGSLGSPGVDELRWHKPVRPGDTLRMRTAVLVVTPSRSKPDRGVVRIRYEILNQQRETVMSMIAIGMFARRAIEAAAPPATK